MSKASEEILRDIDGNLDVIDYNIDVAIKIFDKRLVGIEEAIRRLAEVNEKLVKALWKGSKGTDTNSAVKEQVTDFVVK